jgi:hypothetical protein
MLIVILMQALYNGAVSRSVGVLCDWGVGGYDGEETMVEVERFPSVPSDALL